MNPEFVVCLAQFLAFWKKGFMAREQFTAEQIINKLWEAEVVLSQSIPIAQVCNKLDISEQCWWVYHPASISAGLLTLWATRYGAAKCFAPFNVVDDYNRKALAIKMDLSLTTKRLIRVLERVAAWRGYPAKTRMDNRPELTSVKVAEWQKSMEWYWSSYSQAGRRKTHTLNDLTWHTAKRFLTL